MNLWVNTMFGGHGSSANGDIKYLTRHVTLQIDLVEGSSNFMSGSSSRYITTLPSLVVMGVVVVELYCFYFVR